MNLSIISAIYKKKSKSNKKNVLKLNSKSNIKIIKLKGRNQVNNLQKNKMKFSTHYIGEMDKKFGITTVKLNADVLKQLKTNDLLNHISNQEINNKSFLNLKESLQKKFNESYTIKTKMKFDQIDIPNNNNFSFENRLSENLNKSLFYQNTLLKSYNHKNNYNLKKFKLKNEEKNRNFSPNIDNLIQNSFYNFNFNYNSRNLPFFNSNDSSFKINKPISNIKSILSKNTSEIVYPYEIKYKKVKTCDFFNESFSNGNYCNVLKSNNFNYRKLFNNNEINSVVRIFRKKNY